MKTRKTERTLLTIGLIFLALVFFTSDAFSWGWATHAYIDDHLGKKENLRNMNEIYGGMSPDIFSYMFESPYLQNLYSETHYDFMEVWNAAKFGHEKPFAYGFVSHNEDWGADSTAHISCLTCVQEKDGGYAVIKAEELLTSAPLPSELGIPDPIALEIYHEIVESGVDILVKRNEDPLIGQKIMSSALLRNPRFPILLVKAYADDLSPYFGGYVKAAKAIVTAEKEFRETVILYGYALTQDESTAIQLISEQMADLAESFLSAYGIPLPLSKGEVVVLINELVQASISLCEPDYVQEITATTSFVTQNMMTNRILY
jgi:hypothetical protein